MSLEIHVAKDWFMSVEICVVRDLHNTLDLDFTTATQPIRALSLAWLGAPRACLALWNYPAPPPYSSRINYSVVARAFPGGRLAHPEGQNEEENENSLRKHKKTWSKFEEKIRKVELLPTRDCEAGYGPAYKFYTPERQCNVCFLLMNINYLY